MFGVGRVERVEGLGGRLEVMARAPNGVLCQYT